MSVLGRVNLGVRDDHPGGGEQACDGSGRRAAASRISAIATLLRSVAALGPGRAAE
jgi:hypothetical protein